MHNSDAGRARPFAPPFNTDNIPGELLALPNWTCWKYDYEKLRDGKPSKPPISVRTGYPVSWSKSENQHAFANVYAAALKHGGGIGFVLKSEDGIIALDLDHVLTDGMLVQWARRLIDMQPDTYWEISPSGNGVRGFVRGRLPAERHISCVPSPDTKLEVFSEKKYVTVTSARFENAPSIIAQADEAFMDVLIKHLGSERSKPTGSEGRASVGVTPVDLSSPVGSLQRGSDDAILERLRTGASSEKFRALYDRGDLSAAKTPGDHSSARIALCNMFMPACMAAARGNTGAALAQGFRLMRESVLFCTPEYEKKWDRLGLKELQNALTTREIRAESKGLDRPIAPECETWPDFQELPDIVMSAPTMDASLVPKALRDFCVDEAEKMCVHLETIADPLIVAFTSAVGRRVAIAPKQLDLTWKEYPTLWGIHAAPPSHKKTPAAGVALQFIRALDSKAHAEYLDDRGDFEVRKNELQNEINELNHRRSGGDAEKAERKEQIKELLKAREKLHSPKERRYVVRDATVEAIGEIIRANPQGVLCHRDELAGWFADLEKSGREGEKSFWLSAWSGSEDGSCDRITRGRVYVPRIALSLLGSIQPGPLKELVQAAHYGGADANGLLQRFGLPLCLNERPIFRYVDRPLNAAAHARVASLFDALEHFDPVAFGASMTVGDVPIFRFSPEAQETFIAWLVTHEARLDSPEVACVPPYQAHLAKSPKTLATLALIFHLIYCIDAETKGPVSADALELAIAWVKFHEEHIAVLHDVANASPWKKLAWFIEGGRVADSVALRDLWKNGWSGLDSPDAIRSAVAALSPYGWCRIEERKPEGGGPPAVILRIHPNLRRAGRS